MQIELSVKTINPLYLHLKWWKQSWDFAPTMNNNFLTIGLKQNKVDTDNDVTEFPRNLNFTITISFNMKFATIVLQCWILTRVKHEISNPLLTIDPISLSTSRLERARA